MFCSKTFQVPKGYKKNGLILINPFSVLYELMINYLPAACCCLACSSIIFLNSSCCSGVICG